MQADQNIPLAQLVCVFTVLLAAGTLFTVPLFKFNWHKFLHSNLFIKIIFWIPIFGIFLAALYMGNPARLVLLTILLAISLMEFISVLRTRAYSLLPCVYFLLFSLALAHLILIEKFQSTEFVNLLITMTFASVLADVTAFFLGNYFGYHKLPVALNKNKSWEGVAGQILGAFFGVLIVNTFINPVLSLWLFLPIGLGSAAGDLANSFVKRRLNIKDWSKAIPGHGGLIDRLSSFAGSVIITFYCLKIF
jgi:phosphatidate cytidylyltransferase